MTTNNNNENIKNRRHLDNGREDEEEERMISTTMIEHPTRNGNHHHHHDHEEDRSSSTGGLTLLVPPPEIVSEYIQSRLRGARPEVIANDRLGRRGLISPIPGPHQEMSLLHLNLFAERANSNPPPPPPTRRIVGQHTVAGILQQVLQEIQVDDFLPPHRRG